MAGLGRGAGAASLSRLDRSQLWGDLSGSETRGTSSLPASLGPWLRRCPPGPDSPESLGLWGRLLAGKLPQAARALVGLQALRWGLGGLRGSRGTHLAGSTCHVLPSKFMEIEHKPALFWRGRSVLVRLGEG